MMNPALRHPSPSSVECNEQTEMSPACDSFNENGLNDVTLLVFEFMTTALNCADPGRYRRNLGSALMHQHANHALRLWLLLLGTLRSTLPQSLTHFNRLLEVVRDNAVQLLTNCHGVRIVNVVLIEFGDTHVVGPLLETMLGCASRLYCFSMDQYANHAIQLALAFQQDRIFNCVDCNFGEFAPHPIASHVVKKCMHEASAAWLSIFTETFIKEIHTVAKRPNHSRPVVKALMDGLTKNGLSELFASMQESLLAVPALSTDKTLKACSQR